MAPHPKSVGFNQRRVAVKGIFTSFSYGIHHFKKIVAVNLHAAQSIAPGAVNEIIAGILFIGRGGKPVAVIFDHKDDREFPNSSQVQGFMEFALACAPVATKTTGHKSTVAKFRSERKSVSYRHGCRQVGDHPKDTLLFCAKMEGAIPASGKTIGFAQPLTKESVQINAARGKDAKIPVHRQQVVVVIQSCNGADRDSFLPDTGKPFTDFVLPQQLKHAVFDAARQQQLFIKFQRAGFANLFCGGDHRIAKIFSFVSIYIRSNIGEFEINCKAEFGVWSIGYVSSTILYYSGLKLLNLIFREEWD